MAKKSKNFSPEISVFHGRNAPEPGMIAGYAAIIEYYTLPVPLPARIALISKKKRQYETDEWIVLTPRHQPADTLYGHLVFALKYEGVNLLLFKKLFEKTGAAEVEKIVSAERLGQYSRRIWFLFEWLTGKKLRLPDLDRGNIVPLIDDTMQYTVEGTRSRRHKILNNLPGEPGFCPLIFKTNKLEKYISEDLSGKQEKFLSNVHKDLLQRASAFLLLKDSKASFTIEGERGGNLAVRWGKAIGQAGAKKLSKAELVRLQQIVIEDSRFVKLGYRTEGGFIGEHDRITGEPLPDHISARWQDIDTLIEGMLNTHNLLRGKLDPVLICAMISFGFVFIHPFQDGNGRIHRFLIHHVLAENNFSRQGMIFPVSSSILDNIDRYRRVLESFSHPLLDFIKWKPTAKNNVEVLNETIDYYRYFDATRLAEFLYDCVHDTITRVIPEEVRYLQAYDKFKSWMDNHFDMPDKTVSLLVNFLGQNDGKFSTRARKKEFAKLSDKEVNNIEKIFSTIFHHPAHE